MPPIISKRKCIRHIGFSFHASADQLDEILKRHPEAEFVQLQINYADWEDPEVQSRQIYEVARKYDKPVIIMEPVKGGLLAEPPQNVARILREADPQASFSNCPLAPLHSTSSSIWSIDLIIPIFLPHKVSDIPFSDLEMTSRILESVGSFV